jgi:hypothetical protein
LRGLQAFLLFLFVKDRVDAAVGMVSVTAERADVLLLVSLVANNDITDKKAALPQTEGGTKWALAIC